MAINSPFGESSVFHESFEWMGDKKKDKNKSLSIEYDSVEQLNKTGIIDYENVIFVFIVSSKNLNDVNATFELTPYNLYGILPEKTIIGNNTILPNGEKRVKIKVSKYIAERTDARFEVKVICDGISSSTGKFKLDGNAEKQKNNSCFCNRDFTPSELQNIVIELRKNTFYDKKSIYTYHTDYLFHSNSETKEEYKNEIIPVEDRIF
ncbi:MAG TPA: hypothetical protein PKX92_05845 [Edaphocola sp.]|nr:hypothetical protein [Edaphocola sp.]